MTEKAEITPETAESPMPGEKCQTARELAFWRKGWDEAEACTKRSLASVLPHVKDEDLRELVTLWSAPDA